MTTIDIILTKKKNKSPQNAQKEINENVFTSIRVFYAKRLI